jgi:hypothetical protein
MKLVLVAVATWSVLWSLCLLLPVQGMDLRGSFEVNDPVAGCNACEDGDPVSGTCSCAPSLTTTAYRVITDCAGPGTLTGGHISLCSGSPTASSFGGAYQIDDEDAPGGLGCRVPNPTTGGCSCPPGYAGRKTRTLADIPGGLVGSNIYWCLGAAVSAYFGGVYQVKDGAECFAANSFTDSCRCPDGYATGAFRAIIDGPKGSTIYLCRRGKLQCNDITAGDQRINLGEIPPAVLSIPQVQQGSGPGQHWAIDLCAAMPPTPKNCGKICAPRGFVEQYHGGTAPDCEQAFSTQTTA